MDIEARIQTLTELPWQDIKDAAEAVSVEKPEDKSWKDMVEAIAQAEAEQAKQPEEEKPTVATTESPPKQPKAVAKPVAAESLPKPTVSVATKPDYTQSFLYKAGITICLNCGAKKCRHSDGTVVRCCDNPRFS